MLKRFKFRAERDEKDVVSVENGILSVGGIPVFSQRDGKIASNTCEELNAAGSQIGQIIVVA